jgi:endoglucanase
LNRRQFIHAAGAFTAAAVSAPVLSLEAADKEPASARHLPRWRGFNLLEKFVKQPGGNPRFREADFALVAECGFDFMRLPLSYLCWTDPNDWLKLREEELKHLDEAVAFGGKHQVHVNLNLHRAPGYCVNSPKERLSLWKDEEALSACAFQWAQLAKRYQGIPNERLSFDLINEPGAMIEETYVRVVTRLVESIRVEDPRRLIIADGLAWGRQPVYGLVGLGIAQSTRGYEPTRISHYKASWVFGAGEGSEPTWPLKRGENSALDKETLRRERIQPWKKLEQEGVGVHVGEWGAYIHTPHKVVLAWMRDCLALWKEAGWGWALWNLRGGFGVLDSQRADVEYENFRGQKLDRRMLELLQQG